MAVFPASIVTPERTLLETEVQEVALRTDVGEAAFLAGHTLLIGAIEPGLVRFVHEDGTEERAAVHGGFVHVRHDQVVVVAPVAEMKDDIDLARAQQALEVAAQRLLELESPGRSAASDSGRGSAEDSGRGSAGEDGHVDVELDEVKAAQRRAEVRIEVASGI